MSSILGSRLRLGLIIPSSNRLSEPQFHHYAPDGVGIHVTRMRMTGAYRAPLPELMPRIVEAAQLLADAQCDVIVFHCTATAMEGGLAADQAIVDTIAEATGRVAASTATALVRGLQAVGARRLVLLTPYGPDTHQHEVAFLHEAGFEVVRDRCLGLPGSDAYIAVEPDQWVALAREERDPTADAYVLGCTNIRSIEAIERIEAELGRPVLTSNQATLWHALRLGGLSDEAPGLGRLFRRKNGHAD